MRFFGSIDEVPGDWGPSAVTIGKFDGVHAGHRAIVADLIEAATASGLRSTVLTFDRNPLALLRPAACPPALISNVQKRELIESLGVDGVLMVPFDRAFSSQEPEAFIDRVLLGALGARLVLVGEDFRYGAGGRGDVALLRERLGAQGVEVRVIEEVQPEDGRRASSTWVRELLAAGEVRHAGELLGRSPSVRAVVVKGAQRGRELGYPTANLSRHSEGLIPADGVYAGWLVVDGEPLPAAISVGNNPTFDGVPEQQVEAYVLDADLDLYDKTVEVVFVDFVRGMLKFDGIEPLLAQMADDVERTRGILAVAPRPKTV